MLWKNISFTPIFPLPLRHPVQSQSEHFHVKWVTTALSCHLVMLDVVLSKGKYPQLVKQQVKKTKKLKYKGEHLF